MFRKIEVKGFDETLFEVEQVFYSSKDGTKISMFILHRKASSTCMHLFVLVHMCMYLCKNEFIVLILVYLPSSGGG